MLVRGSALSVLALLVAPVLLGGENLPAQSAQAAETAQQQNAARPAPEGIAARPAASPASASKPPNEARVSWDSRGLEIEAFNSSLAQILHQVAAATGASVEGLTQDQRVFGSYGPGPGCDVLAKLLDGSGYNVLMIGSRDTDAPLRIVLSAASPAAPQTAANNQSRSNPKDDEPEQEERPAEAQRPPPVQNPFGNGEPPREPVQFMQEILQRQQKIDQQQQQQQDQDQQNNPQQ